MEIQLRAKNIKQIIQIMRYSNILYYFEIYLLFYYYVFTSIKNVFN